VRQDGAGLRQWAVVVSSADGSKIFALGYFAVVYSLNGGLTWTEQRLGGELAAGVDVSSDGNTLVAVTQIAPGDSGDGSIWTGQVIPPPGESTNNLVDLQPHCYYNMSTTGGDRYCPGPPSGLSFPDVYMVSKMLQPYLSVPPSIPSSILLIHPGRQPFLYESLKLVGTRTEADNGSYDS